MEGDLPFLLCFTLYLRAISKYKPPGGLYLERQFNRGLFVLFSEFYGTCIQVSNVSFLLPTVPHHQYKTEERMGKGDFSQQFHAK